MTGFALLVGLIMLVAGAAGAFFDPGYRAVFVPPLLQGGAILLGLVAIANAISEHGDKP